MANTLKFKRGLVGGIPTAALGEPLFTTDTFDLYIGNGTSNTRFQKYIASGATTQILRGDGSLYSFPLNISSATNGQVLQFDGTNWVNSNAGSGTVTSVAATVPTGFSITGSPITTSGTLAITFAAGYSLPTTAKQTEWDTAYTNRITSLTTTGSSGAATLISNTLNIPNYTLSGLGGVPTTRTLTINGTAFDLSADRSWSVGTVTSVAALTIGTTGTDITSTVATGTTTPVITLNVPTASATNRGALSSTDWTTFNNKQGTITLTTTGNSGAATFSANTLNIPNYTLAGLGGFANPMTTLGDVIYGGASGVATRLAGNTTTAKQYLSQTGTGSASAAPAWATITGADITGAALTKTDDTNVTLTLGGTPATALLRAASLTLGWTGQLAIARGGTGLSALGTAGQLLRVNTGATALEYFTPTYITGNQTITISGDASGSGTTAITLTLATVNSNVGTFNNVTVNAKGLVTAASNVAYLTAAITSLNGLTAATQTFSNDTNVTITSATSTHTIGWAGTLAVSRGGTGAATLTGVLIGNGTSAVTAVVGTASQLLRRNAGNTAYEFFSPTYMDNPMTTLGDIIYGAASGTPTRLAGNTTTAKQYLSQTGNGTASAAPSWAAIAGADVTGAALTKTDDTNVTLTLGGTPSTALLRAASLTLGWTGTLAVSRGGTGAGTLTGVVIGNGTNAMTAISSTTALQVLRVNAAGTGYEFATISAGGGTPAGSTGQVQFNNAGAFGADSNFFWDNTNKRLGINAPTPSSSLDVIGLSKFNVASGTSQANIVEFLNSTNNGYHSIVGAGTTSAVATWTNGSIINEVVPAGTGNGIFGTYSGNLIFQTNNRTNRLTIASTGEATFSNRVTVTGGSTNNILVSASSASVTIPTTGLSLNTGFNVGYIQNYNGGSLVDLYYSASKHIIDGGNLIIQTGGTITDNGAKLQVSGSATISGNIQVGGSAISGNSSSFYNTTNETSVVIKQTSGPTQIGLALWNNATTGNNTFVKFYTETTATEKGSISYDRTPDKLLIAGPAGGLSFTGAATFSSLAGTGTRMVVADASGVLSTQAIPGGGSGTPGGSTGEVQFNSSGAFGGDSNFTWNNTTKILTVKYLTINSSGQSLEFSSFYGSGSNGSNIFIGGGGKSSISSGVAQNGSDNTSLGYSALQNNTTGFSNTAIGNLSMLTNTSGYGNVALGVSTLYSNTSGIHNTAIGIGALQFNTTANYNTALGYGAGAYTNAAATNQTSSNSIYIGYDTRSSASGNTNEIVIGYNGRGNGSNTITLGNTSTVDTYVLGRLRASTGITDTRIDPRTISTTSTATLTPDVSADDVFTVTAQAATITLANPTGTPVEGQKILVRIKDNGTARSIQYGTQYRASSDYALPTTTTISKTIYLGFIYNSTDTKWDLLAKLDGF